MKKVLVVDDERELRRTVKNILEDENYQSKTAKTTDEALEIVQQWHPDLILLDILIPGMELKTFFTKLDDVDKCKVLYLSVVNEVKAKREGLLTLSNKIEGYISKPFSLDVLLSKVEAVLEDSAEI